MQTLGSVQKDLCELQIKTSRIQVGIGQGSAEKVNLTPETSQATKLVRILELRNISLPDGSMRTESIDDHIILSTFKNIGLNIAVLYNETLHVLHMGVADELRTREQHAFNLISEYKVNNEKMFIEKTQALKKTVVPSPKGLDIYVKEDLIYKGTSH